MPWAEKLSRVEFADGASYVGASFRGVPFYVSGAEMNGGRRVVTHEFPGRDVPQIDDMGKRASRHRIDGYVLGDNYMAARNALLDALESTSGPGLLVHPYLGALRVICSSLSMRESTREGGFAKFDLEFTAAPNEESLALAGLVDEPAAVAAAALDVRAKTTYEFVASFDAAGQPAFALDSLSSDVAGVTDSLRISAGPVAKTAQAAAKLSAQLDLLSATASSLLHRPADLVAEVEKAAQLLWDASAGHLADALDTFLSAAQTIEPAPATGATPSRERERANQAALSFMLRTMLLSRAAEIAPLVPFISIAAALYTRDAIITQINRWAGLAPIGSYSTLVMLRSLLMVAMPSDSVKSRIVNIQQMVPVPALVFMYRLTGRSDGADDLIVRNQIAHPGFASGDLEALVNV